MIQHIFHINLFCEDGFCADWAKPNLRHFTSSICSCWTFLDDIRQEVGLLFQN